ncbi:periplasmic copper chaperone A [Gammaproteobacteria bacterium]
MKMRSILFSSVLPLVWLGVVTPVCADVVVESPWVREAPPTAKMLASYMVLRNNGDSVEVLKGATAKGFNQVEIHLTTVKDGVASMEAQESLSIPAQGSVSLAPGGYHLMLIEGDHPLKEGETVKLSLQFNDEKTIDVEAPVRKDATAPEGHGGHLHHKSPHD